MSNELLNWQVHELKAQLSGGNPIALEILRTLIADCSDADARELLELLEARVADAGCLGDVDLPAEFWSDVAEEPEGDEVKFKTPYPSTRFKLRMPR